MASVLVVDDDKQFRRMAKEILVQAGYEAAEAQDGQEALSLCQKGSFDLVIIDIFMPEKDGLEAINELRQDFPDIKVLAISGGVGKFQVDVLAMAKKFGAHQTITKPFDVEAFLNSVHAVLEQKAIHGPRN